MKFVGELLITSIKEKISKDDNIANVLADILPLGKEAIYRRLRSEVPFTLDEALVICRKFNISLDYLAGMSQDKMYAFHLNTLAHAEGTIENYRTMLRNIINTSKEMKGDASVLQYMAYNSMPLCFLYGYKYLSRIYLYILNYQLNSHISEKIKPFSEINFFEDIYELQKESLSSVHDFDSVIILDKTVFYDSIRIINYFELMGLIEKSDVELIKADFHEMMNDIEKCASEGLSFSGKKMSLYLCEISFDCSYFCLESDSVFISSMGVYCLDYMTSFNRRIFEIQKKWINSLIKFSSLISVSDELKRREFFKSQRQYIDMNL